MFCFYFGYDIFVIIFLNKVGSFWSWVGVFKILDGMVFNVKNKF